MDYWKPTWRILSIILLACEMSAIVWQFEHSLALTFFGIGIAIIKKSTINKYCRQYDKKEAFLRCW